MPINASIYGALDEGGGNNSGPFGFIYQLMQLDAMKQSQQYNRLRLRGLEQDMDDDLEIRKTISRHMPSQVDFDNLDPDAELPEPDWGKVLFDLNSGGRGTAALKLQESIIEVRKKQLGEIQERVKANETRVKMASRLAQGITDEDSFRRAVPVIRGLMGDGIAQLFGNEYDPKVVSQIMDMGRDATELISAQRLAFDKANEAYRRSQDLIKSDRDWEDKKQKLHTEWTQVGSANLSLARSQQDWNTSLDLLKKGMDFLPNSVKDPVLAQFGDTWSKEAVERARLLGMTQSERSQEKDRKEGRYLEWKRLTDMEDAVPNLSPEAKRIAAHQWVMTGQLPTTGIGVKSTKLKAEIMNMGADMFPNLDLPTQIASYKATQLALNDRTRQLSSITAFEDTALKNLEQFLGEAKKVVDTGSPWINKPVRTIDQRLLGSKEMAAFNAARTVVIPEFARIITNPNLTGILSDSARKEVNDVLSGDYNLKQIYDVARILKADAANRRISLQTEVDALTKRIAQPPATTTQYNTPTGLRPAMAGEEVEQGGQRFKIWTNGKGEVIRRERWDGKAWQLIQTGRQ